MPNTQLLCETSPVPAVPPFLTPITQSPMLLASLVADALVLNKWFTIQATASKPDVLDDVKRLTQHPEFTLKNPNRCRALLSAFTANSAAFHQDDGSAYSFIGEKIAALDALNPQIASRMSGSLISYKRYDGARAAKMKAELERISKIDGLSPDTFEVVSRALK